MNINLPYAYLPENYQFFEVVQEAQFGMPKGAVIYGVLIGETKAILSTWEVDQETSMDFNNPHGVIDYLHEHMGDNEGIIEVKAGVTKAGNPIIYNILKQRLHDDGTPGNGYLINLNFQIGDHIYFVNGFFEEYGTTGIRESNVFAMYQKDHPNLEDPFEGWSRDPYDPSFTKGFLRNLSEHQQFDRFCPGHPLSQARAYIDYIVNNN